MPNRVPGKFGRLPGKVPVGLRELGFYAAGPLPKAPAAVEVPAVATWLMLGNGPTPSNPSSAPTGMGDCGVAGLEHGFMADASVTGERESFPDAAQALDYYLSFTNGQDTGVVLSDYLAHVRSDPYYGHTVDSYAPVNVHDVPTLQFCVWAYNFAYCGIVVTEAMQETFANREPWEMQTLEAPVAGGHCVTPGTRVLTDTLEWAPIADLLPGDGLVAFDEYSRSGHRRHFRKGRVESTERLVLPCFELAFDDGTVVTSAYDHLWLTGGATSAKPRWLRTDQMRPMGPSGNYGTITKRLFDTWEADASWGAGYLAAAFDGEGWIDGNAEHIRRLGFCQRENAMLETTRLLLKERGFDYGEYLHSSPGQYGADPLFNITIRRRREALRFLGTLRPQRLLSNCHPDRLGAVNASPTVRLVRKTFVGDQEVVALGTDTKTYIAEGLPSHNCVPVVGYDDTFITVVTWGAVQDVSWPAWHHMASEAYAVITGELVARDGDGRGVSLDALRADLNSFAA